MALRVREVADHEVSPRGLVGAHPARPAEALGLLERGLDVGNADVEDHVAVVAHASADAARDPDPVVGRVAVDREDAVLERLATDYEQMRRFQLLPIPSLVVLRSTNP